MKKRLLSLLAATALLFSAQAQDLSGFNTSNYSGVNGIDVNPANVVNSRYKVDVTLVGASVSGYNNYVGMRYQALASDKYGRYYAFDDTLFQDHYLTLRNHNVDKRVIVGNQIYLPSVLVSINQKNAIAVSAKVRTLVNIDGVSEYLGQLIYHGLDYPQLWMNNLHNDNLQIHTMSWAEYGVTYGHVFKDEGEHFFKAGVTLKYIQGLQAAYVDIRDLDYNFTNDTTLSLFHSEVNYGHSTNFETNQKNYSINPAVGASFAIDLGAEYEWRPDWQSYKYDMDGETNLWRKDKNKYKLKVGVAVTDLGNPVKFKKGTYSHDFTADINAWNLNDFNHVQNVAQYDSTLRANFKMNDGDKYFKVGLPLAISAQVDYQIWKDFYVNLTPYWAPKFRNKNENVHDLSMISLTPRYDYKWAGVFVPVTYDALGNTRVGLALRAGPIVVGTSCLGNYLVKKDMYGADAYVLLKIPIMYSRPKDRDHDKVSNKKDKCPDTPGVWEFLGCPDKDGDHVQDKDDLCPDVPGLVQFHGCPDRDGDGIIDSQDACPDDPGLPEFNGCPDKDGDKIIDKEDDCPDVPGLAIFHGCPDTDNDGIMDKEDHCPTKPGPRSNDGCPEVRLVLINDAGGPIKTSIQSKDGGFSYDELPADDKVVFRLEGDSIEYVNEVKVIVGGITKKAIRDPKDRLFRFIVLKPDNLKLQPEAAQDVAIKLNKEEAEVLKKAFDNLEFATAKDIIKPESYGSLDELAALMKKKPEWRLKISGHTDSQGKAATNMKLSEKRAKAVQNYLVNKGVDPKRFKVEWFGATKPIASNKTEAGRQKNRRVEMLIIE